jgi:hypothetical protein
MPSGASKSVVWRQAAPIEPTLEAAKKCAAQIIEALSADARYDDMERTNWTSVVAAIQKIVMDWNDKRREALYAEGPNASPH